jgi:ABC-type proline/glycine betaine transport system permease subunit
VGAAVGSNNLGQPIFAGIRGSDRYAILSGALPVAMIGLMLDALLLGMENLLARARGITTA